MELSRSATLNEISRRKSDQISGREEVIAGAVKHRVAHQSRPYGIKVEHVTITQARLRFPLPHEGISPLAEASRLDQMDPAVRRVSMKTVQHAEHLTDAQAGAANNAGGQNIK
jgi:hypothetical protein